MISQLSEPKSCYTCLLSRVTARLFPRLTSLRNTLDDLRKRNQDAQPPFYHLVVTPSANLQTNKSYLRHL